MGRKIPRPRVRGSDQGPGTGTVSAIRTPGLGELGFSVPAHPLWVGWVMAQEAEWSVLELVLDVPSNATFPIWYLMSFRTGTTIQQQ